MASQNSAQSAYLEINSLGRCTFAQTSLLVATNVLGLNVSNKTLFEVRAKVFEIVTLDALRRGGKSEALEHEPLVRGNRKELGAVASFYSVVALLQLTA